MKYIYSIITIMALGLFVGCTNLDEKVYSIITSENYYKTSDDIIRASVRPYDHAYWSIQSSLYVLQENTADHVATFNRQGNWLDGQRYFRLHYHTWTIDDADVDGGWSALFTGISQVNAVLDDLAKLDPISFGMTKTQFLGIENGLRILRCWFYIKALDMYRNIPLAVSLQNQELNTLEQIPPRQIFDFIEKELTEALPNLPKKETRGGNLNLQGQWTQAGAAALLVRLYLNAEKWIGTPKYTECADYAQKIIDGEYGPYTIADRWDAPFDWNNETCDELIFGFSGSFGYSNYQYGKGMFRYFLPTFASLYFNFTDWGNFNFKYGLQPGKDINGNEYAFDLGKPVVKFQKYPEDFRLKLYKNLGNSSRQGMFLFGYLEYTKTVNGKPQILKVTDSSKKWNLYLRDQAGWFESLPPDQILEDKESNMNHADQNSGWCLVKYPFYSSDDPGKIEADYAEIRLAEIYYSLAEAKYRLGDKNSAALLLNQVRKRYYPKDKYTEYLYAPEGKVVLSDNEFIDEWGREFLGEGRRRTDLCRWDKFTNGIWWDKEPDGSNHLDIFPLSRTVLGANDKLKQNPGYDDIER